MSGSILLHLSHDGSFQGRSEKLSAKDTMDVTKGRAGPTVSHGKATAECRAESAKRLGAGLVFGSRQWANSFPSHGGSYIKKKLHLRLQSYCLSFLVCMTKTKKADLQKTGWKTAGEGYEDDALLRLWF